MYDLKAFQSSLVRFLGKQTWVKSYITMTTIFGTEESARMIKVRYLVIDASFSYDMTVGRLASNHIRVTISTLYMCMKYPLPDRRVRVIQRDQETAIRYYMKV